jgi:hypothetical protein
METTFYILLSMKTNAGYENYGRFYIGNDKKAAYSLFANLKGTPDANEKAVLNCDFMETRDGLPINLQVLACTLEQIAENCKIITRERFRQLNLEDV